MAQRLSIQADIRHCIDSVKMQNHFVVCKHFPGNIEYRAVFEIPLHQFQCLLLVGAPVGILHLPRVQVVLIDAAGHGSGNPLGFRSVPQLPVFIQQHFFHCLFPFFFLIVFREALFFPFNLIITVCPHLGKG